MILEVPETKIVLPTKLKSLREGKGLSQKALGVISNVSWRSIQNAEQGLSDLGAEALAQLSRALGVTIDTLVLGESTTTPEQALRVLDDFIRTQNSEKHVLRQIEGKELPADPWLDRLSKLTPEQRKMLEPAIQVAEESEEGVKSKEKRRK